MFGRWGWRAPRSASGWGLSVLTCCLACTLDSRGFDEDGCSDPAECPESMLGAAAGAGGAGPTPAAATASSAAGTTADEAPAGSGGAPTGASVGGALGESAVGSGGAMFGGAGAGGSAIGSAGASGCPTNLLLDGGFESASTPWVSFTTGQDPLIYDATEQTYEGVTPHGGQRLGWLGGVPSETNRLSQTVSVPAVATGLALQCSIRIQIFEVHPNIDFLRIRLVIAGQPVPLGEFTNGNAGNDWFDFTPPPATVMTNGQAISATLEIESEIGAGPGTNFYVDDLALVPSCAPE
jgi:hypothetical protein